MVPMKLSLGCFIGSHQSRRTGLDLAVSLRWIEARAMIAQVILISSMMAIES
jgi:hypothetical protein